MVVEIHTMQNHNQFEWIIKLYLLFQGFHGDGKSVNEQLVLRHRKVRNVKANTGRDKCPHH